jgi:hypothetical protein
VCLLAVVVGTLEEGVSAEPLARREPVPLSELVVDLEDGRQVGEVVPDMIVAAIQSWFCDEIRDVCWCARRISSGNTLA